MRKIGLMAITVWFLTSYSAAASRVTITLNPFPDGFSAATLVGGAGNNLYLNGFLGGSTGIMKIDPSGNLSMFFPGSLGNLVTTDAEGKTLFSISTSSGVLRKIPLASNDPVETSSLNPVPDAYFPGSFTVGADGTLYVGGILNGSNGLLKISPAGSVSLWVSSAAVGFSIGNLVTSDVQRKNIYCIRGSTLARISMDSGILQETAQLLPVPSGFSLGELTMGADGRLYAAGILTPSAPRGLMAIDPDGSVTEFDPQVPGHLVRGFDGKTLYVINTAAPITIFSGVSAAPTQGATLWRYDLSSPSINNSSLPPETHISLQGGMKGYVNTALGEKMRIGFITSSEGQVTVKVYDLSGRLVWETVKDSGAGTDFIDWAGVDQSGAPVPSNVYIIKVKGPGIDEFKKGAVLR